MQSVPIPAFNLMVGAVYAERSGMLSEQPKLVVTQVLYRHDNSERIGLVVRNLDVRHADAADMTDPPLYEAPSYDFNKEVYLVGLCVNPDTWDERDFGQDY